MKVLMKKGLFCLLILTIALLAGCSNQSDDLIKKLVEVNSSLLLANNKMQSGYLNDALNDYTSMKLALEPYVYNNSIDKDTQAQVQQIYEQIKVRIDETNLKIKVGSSRQSASILLPKFSEEYDALLAEEVALTKEYKYNPEITDSKDFDIIKHCNTVKIKILTLNQKQEKLYREINDTPMHNSKDIEFAKNYLLEKVSSSYKLSTLMLKDYENWCKSRITIQERNNLITNSKKEREKLGKLGDSLDESETIEYHYLLKEESCGLKDSGNKLNEERKSRLDFLNSTEFKELLELLQIKSYPMPSSYFNGPSNLISKENEYITIETFYNKTYPISCVFFTKKYDYYKDILPVVNYDNKFTQEERNLVVSKLIEIYDTCNQIKSLQDECRILKEKIFDSYLNCDMVLGVNCELIKLEYQKYQAYVYN